MTSVFGESGVTRAQANALLNPGYVSGLYYGSPFIVAIRSTDAQVVDSLRAIPFRIYSTVTVDRLALRVATGVAGNAKCGIYAAAPTAGQYPSALVAEVNADIATGVAGDFEAGFSSNPVLTPALYWFATCCSALAQVTTVSANAMNGMEDEWGGPNANAVLNASVATKTTGFVRTAALTYVAATPFFPAMFGVGTLLANNPGAPLVAMRAV